MELSTSPTGPGLAVDGPNLESSASGINWTSILGGAAAATAISLIMLPLGAALGFSSFSVFTATAGTAIIMTSAWAIWLVIMQWVSSLVGGYIAGRLRVKWAALHSDEVFFRDTAHGFISWAVATIVVVAVVAGTAVSGIKAGAAAADDTVSYYVDSLYRTSTPQTIVTSDVTDESARILLKGATDGEVTTDDRSYLASLISARTGLSPDQAKARIDATLNRIEADKTKAAEAVETARKALARASLILFLSLLIGAFISSVAAAFAGRLRDQVG